jgi:hypothetical protein
MLSTVCAGFGIAVAVAEALADPCPESCVLDYCSTWARRDTSVFGGTLFGSPGNGAGSYDLVAGWAKASFRASTEGSAPGGSAIARDRFKLVGPISQSAISFTVAFALVGSAFPNQNNGGAFVGGSVREGNNPPVSAGGDLIILYPEFYYWNLSKVLSLPLNHPVGEAFELTYQVNTSGSGSGSNGQVQGTLFFPDAPPGYGVVSCQGYSSGAVVSTRPLSWGRLKALYR